MRRLKLQIGLVAIVFMMLASCVTTQPLNRQFYNTKKVGIILQVDSIGMAKAGSQGLLDMAFTPGNRFREPLKKVETKLTLKETLRTEIEKILTVKNKNFTFLEEKIDYDKLKKFDKPKSDKKYPKKDYRSLQLKESVDEILIIKVRYGLLVSYYGMIETGKQGYVYIDSEIIDLTDNSLLQKENYQSVADIDGNWKKGQEYENLKNAIQEAINSSIKTFKTKF